MIIETDMLKLSSVKCQVTPGSTMRHLGVPSTTWEYRVPPGSTEYHLGVPGNTQEY